MDLRIVGACGAVALTAASCTQSYDDFVFGPASQTGTATTVTGTGTATGGTGGAGAQGGTGGATGGTTATGGSGTAGSGGSVAVDCATQYTSGAIHELCVESATECEFRVRTNQDDCETICADGGGECLSAYNDNPNGSCTRGDALTCQDDGMNSQLCICSVGCGSGPPCVSPQMCSSGTCN
ncbi:MAG: hypothetical protein JRI23_29220 [Deltaproteobacteria bacterium]|nr:hypothetical protein [Deltaproteobacteria bacterium]MBW2536220.1 hypothetical protein [Deltaproteobacteria bacterium]